MKIHILIREEHHEIEVIRAYSTEKQAIRLMTWCEQEDETLYSSYYIRTTTLEDIND